MRCDSISLSSSSLLSPNMLKKFSKMTTLTPSKKYNTRSRYQKLNIRKKSSIFGAKGCASLGSRLLSLESQSTCQQTGQISNNMEQTNTSSEALGLASDDRISQTNTVDAYFEPWVDPSVSDTMETPSNLNNETDDKENQPDNHSVLIVNPIPLYSNGQDRNPLSEINVSSLPEYQKEKKHSIRAAARNLFNSRFTVGPLAASPSTPSALPMLAHPSRGSRMLLFGGLIDKRVRPHTPKDSPSKSKSTRLGPSDNDPNKPVTSPITPSSPCTTRRLRPRPTRPPRVYGTKE